MTESELPPLREIGLFDVLKYKEYPNPKIRTDQDVDMWRHTRSYQDYALFLRRLNEAVVGYSFPLDKSTPPSEAVGRTIALLDILDRWIDEIPPLETPQRFGNLSFRRWGARLEERADELLDALLSPAYAVVTPHVKPLLLASFGSFTRMDYGTGHETSFALFLLALSLVRFFHSTPEEERALVLRVFVRYLRLCWKLQDAYRLEPAGSHGVWGLDDSHFLGYIFGSGQLRDQTEMPVSAVLRPSLPASNLYFMLITRIHQVKIGPFHEHSSQLYSIAVGVPNWRKVNSGLFKMYEAEVLGKRVVVQHIPLGGLLEWDDRTTETIATNSNPVTAAPGSADPSSLPIDTRTQAPWATSMTTTPTHATHVPTARTAVPFTSSSQRSAQSTTSLPPFSSTSIPRVAPPGKPGQSHVGTLLRDSSAMGLDNAPRHNSMTPPSPPSQ